MRAPWRAAGVGVALFVSSASASALAADEPKVELTKDECITANETGQTLRQSGKLRQARAQLLVCIDKGCPDIVRDDCSERLNELDRTIPTIVFTAKGAADADLAAVTVTMDGAPFAPHLDGAAIAVDPGEHTFVFTAEGYPTQTRILVIAEGAKGRQEEISFAPEAPPAPPAQPVAPEQPLPNGDTQRLISYVVGGAGILTLGFSAFFGLKAQSTYDDASSRCPTTDTCDPDGVSLGKDAHGLATASTVTFIAGGALLAGGVILYLTAPARHGVNVRPTANASGAGLGLGGSW